MKMWFALLFGIKSRNKKQTFFYFNQNFCSVMWLVSFVLEAVFTEVTLWHQKTKFTTNNWQYCSLSVFLDYKYNETNKRTNKYQSSSTVGFTKSKMAQPNKWCLLRLQGKVSYHIWYTLKDELWVLQFNKLLNPIICQFRYKMRHYKCICFFRTLTKEEKFTMRELVSLLLIGVIAA